MTIKVLSQFLVYNLLDQKLIKHFVKYLLSIIHIIAAMSLRKPSNKPSMDEVSFADKLYLT